VHYSVTEISPLFETQINTCFLTLSPDSRKGSNFRNGVLVFTNEMMGKVQRPCNLKPQKEGGDRDREREKESTYDRKE
jgi:hypothetical protein